MPLDIEQQAIVDAPVDANLLVQAGPGSGKTHVLVSRIQALVDEARCSPGEVLVLSFSRAARDELALRIANLPSDSYAHNVTLRTIDSFATCVLLDGRMEAKGDYQQRIIDATEDIKDDPETTRVSQYKHVLIDEAQDIIGVRGAMILELMKALPDAGFTVFADSAQAIYDFAIEDDPTQMHSIEWLNVLEERNTPTECVVHRLQNYYRSSVPEIIRFCRGPWSKLVEQQHEEAGSEIGAMVQSLPSAGSLDALTWPPALGRTRLVVCPNNGQVLYAASRCMGLGGKVKVSRGETDWAHPAWLGRLLIGLKPTDQITLPVIDGKLADRLPEGVTSKQVFDALRIGCQTGQNSPKLQQVVLALNKGVKFPTFMPADDSSVVTFSSIHRSKGREYDEVAFLDYSEWELDQKEPTEGYNQRVRFVGLSRARLKLWSISLPNRPKVKRANATGRWVGVWYSGMNVRVSAIEVGEQGDIDAASFVRAADLSSAMIKQEKIRKITRGTPVTLVLRPGSTLPIYDVLLKDTAEVVGSMSVKFTNTLMLSIKATQGWFKVFPDKISNCWVRGVNTAVPSELEDVQGVPAEIIQGKLWNYLVIEGFGKLDWPPQDNADQ